MNKSSTYYFRSFDPEDQRNAIYSGIRALLSLLDCSFAEEMARDAQACVIHMCRVIGSMNDFSLEHDWIPSAKRHKDEVARICTRIFQVSKSTGISNPVREVRPSSITLYDGFEMREIETIPRSFWKCYRLFAYVQKCKKAEELVAVLQVICCIFTIYKMIGVQGPKLDELAKAHLEEQSSTKIRDNSTTHHLENVVHDFLSHMDACVRGECQPRSKAAESYFAAISLAKKNFKRPSQSRDELPLSTHSSGMSIKGKGTLPAMLASAFEGDLDDYDNTECDQIMQYIPSEKLCDLSNATVRLTRTVFIPHRSKNDVRVVHTASSVIQDRMNYHARVMRQFLKKRHTIHVWNQMRGVKDIIKQFNVYRIRAGYSLDLHAATDTLDRNEQALYYYHLCTWMGYSESEARALSSQWSHYSSIELLVMLPYSGKYIRHRLATGQPMGFESSVDALNGSHDLWATALVDYCEREYGLVSRGHDIIGDDFFIGFDSDKDMVFPQLYKDLMAELNTECNLMKGYIYNADYNEYQVPLAEFAKNLVCDGTNITPLPLGALTLCDTEQGILSFLTWYKERMNIRHIDQGFIMSYFPENGDLIQLLCNLPVQNQFRALAWGSQNLPMFRLQDQRVLLTVAIPFIRQFLMLSILNKLNNDHDYIPRITDYNSVTKEWRQYAKMILRAKNLLPNNKFVALVERMELTAIAQSCSMLDIAHGILPYADENDAVLTLIPALKDLKQEDISLLMEIFDLINNLDQIESYTDTWKPQMSDDLVLSLTDSLNRLVLADFNPTAQRFGVQKEKITAGFDFTELRKEVQRMMDLFDITSEQVSATLSYLSELTKTELTYTWKTVMLDDVLSVDDDQEDIWSLLGMEDQVEISWSL